jgi:SAM-dependent methyltransferase
VSLRHLYDQTFYENQEAESYASARVVLGALWRLYRPSSVVDVGCGVGPWLQVVHELGVQDYVGVDGDHVAPEHLRIPRDHFVTHDLSAPLELGRRFDLAISVEVAEHLPESASSGFVRTLTSLAPVALFSAAVPNQGGVGHVNEQWPEYWAALFAQHGFLAYDCLRPLLWRDEHVAWWYRQNVIVYASGDGLLDDPGPAAEPLALVHPLQIDAILTRPAAPVAPTPDAIDAIDTPPPLRALLRQLPAAAARAARWRLARAKDFVRTRLR